MFQTLIKSTLFSAIMLSALSSAYASHTKVKLGNISAAGNGCLNGEITSHIDQSTGQLIVEPYNYTAILENGASLVRKSCNFAIPFEAPANRAVRLRQYRLKGVAALDESSTAEISLETFFAGLRGEVVTLTLNGNNPISEYEFDETIPELEIVYDCGKDGIIRVNSSLLVKGGANTQVALAHIQKLGIKIDTVACH